MRWVNWCLDSAAVLFPAALASSDSPARCSDMHVCPGADSEHRCCIFTDFLWISHEWNAPRCPVNGMLLHRETARVYWQFTPCCLHSWFLVPVLLQLPLPLGPGAGLGESVPSLHCNLWWTGLQFSEHPNPIFHFQRRKSKPGVQHPRTGFSQEATCTNRQTEEESSRGGLLVNVPCW